MITIDVVWSQDLPDDLKEELEIYEDDIETYLIIRQDGKIISIENDNMEPEDATFRRDLKWVRKMLLEVYKIGMTEGKTRAKETEA